MKIAARELEYEVGDRVILGGVDFSAEPGELTLLIGPNGAGKTTLLKVLALLLPPARGEVRYDSRPATVASTGLRRRVSLLFQKPVLLNLSVYHNLAYPLRLRRMPPDDRLVSSWLQDMGLSKRARQNALTLSGGEAQRLALARALIYRPEAIFLDEPFLNLDPLSEEIVGRIIARLRAEKTTLVLCLHDLDRGFAHADYVYFLEAGKITRHGRRDTFLPGTVSQARFLGVENLFRGEIQNGFFYGEGLKLPVASGHRGNAWVGIRGEHIVLSLAPLDSSARNVLAGRVTALSDRGMLTEVEVEAVRPFRVLITRESKERLRLAPGVKIYLAFKSTSLLVFPA